MKMLLLLLLLLSSTSCTIRIIRGFVILPRFQRTKPAKSVEGLFLNAKKYNTCSGKQNEGSEKKNCNNAELVTRRSLVAAAGMTLVVGTSLSTQFVWAADTTTAPTKSSSNGVTHAHSKWIETSATNTEKLSTVVRISSPPTASISATTTLQESLSGFVAGGALTVTKTLVKYPLDTITVRLQMPKTTTEQQQQSESITMSTFQVGTQEATITTAPSLSLFRDPYRGILNPLLWNVPGGAVFFAVKDAVKSSILSLPSTGSGNVGTYKVLATCVSVLVANIPYWIIRNPSEVVKTKQQAQLKDSVYTNMTSWQVFQALWEENKKTRISSSQWVAAAAVAPFYVGYFENMVYAYPADVIKFLVYEYLSKNFMMGRTMTPAEGAIAGAISTAMAQLITTPLDVVRNRVMTNTTTTTLTTISTLSSTNTSTTTSNNGNMVGMLYDIYHTEGYDGLLAGAWPRVGKAILSGAIQFATYEETKQAILRILQLKH